MNKPSGNERPQFFLRFYMQSEAQVRKHMEEFRRMHPSIIGSSVAPLTASVNAVWPSNSWQATVYFRTCAQRDAVHADKRGKDWYLARAYPGGGTFTERRPGDLVTRRTPS